MIRLIFMMLSLLAAILVVLATFGDGDRRIARLTTGQDRAPKISIRDLFPEAQPVTDTEPTAAEPAATEVVAAAVQTPERVQEFPGPALQPAPEEVTAVQPPADAGGPLLYVTGERVNFRAGPSTGHQVVGALDYGASVVPLGPVDGDWINIRSADGTVGYMSGQFLSPERP